MKKIQRSSVIAAIAATAVFLTPMDSLAGPTVSATTMSNLETAMHGEAYETLLYRAYAMQARLSGDPALAKVFEEIANQEGNDHFMREAVAAGAISDNLSNLESAAKSEMKEQISTYMKYAQQADEAGDKAAGAMFREIANEEGNHYKLLKKAEDKYRAGSH
jgi:rubrerythrin